VRAALFLALFLALVLASGSARAQPAPPPRTKSPGARTQPRTLEMRRDQRPGSAEARDAAGAVPSLDTDPHRAPKGHTRAPARVGKHLPWFVRPSVLFVARFPGSDSYLPQVGFGFGMQAGVTLGSSTLRLSLAAGYHFYRFAKLMDIVVNDPNLTSCTAIRALGIHLVTGSAQAGATFSKVELWVGLRGGFAHAQLKTPTPLCGTADGSHSTGVLGPEFGVGYALRPDLHLGVTVAYLHFFSDAVYTDTESTSSRYFYPILTAGALLSLRF